jgi:polyisoprenoid-binding protein YceI/rhodanese-related sulfurtransferase
MDTQFVERLEAAEVARFVEQGEGVLIDTLPPKHFAARHIPGAVNACVYEMVFCELVSALVPSMGTPVVLYGAGPESLDCLSAADKLARMGYTDVAVFHGGLEEWLAEGRPLEGTAPDALEPPHPVLSIEPRVYRLLPAESILKWTGRNVNGAHHGTLGFASGRLDGAGELSATVTMDMTTIADLDLAGTDLHPVLEKHLHSDDFFFTAMFPEAVFATTAIRLADEAQATRPNAMMQGTLSLRGMRNEIAFPAHIRNIDGGRLAIIANIDIDRTQWGVIYGSSRFFRHLSYHLVFDFISVEFRLVLE